jgi:uncharacterized protein (TIGR02246 family)
MRRGLLVICTGLLFIVAMLGLNPDAPAGDVDAELKSLVTELDNRWNARDADGMSKLFAPDVDFRIYGTTRYQSRDEFRLHYEEAFSKRVPADVRHTTSLETVRIVAAGVAVLDGEVEVGKPGGAALEMRHFYYTALATKRDGSSWVFDTFRVAQKSNDTR